MNGQKHQEAGYVLLGVIFIFAILAVLGTSLVMLSFTSVKTSKIEHDDQAAFYIAEAGLNYKLNQLETEVQEIYAKDSVKNEKDFYNGLKAIVGENTLIDIFDKVDGVQPKADVEVNNMEGVDNEFEIISIGKIGKETRTVSQVIKVNWEDKYEYVDEESPITPIIQTPPFAVFTSGKFFMNNGTIKGDIGTVNSNINSVSFPGEGPSMNGKVYVPQGRSDIVDTAHWINVEVEEIDSSIQFPDLPPFPNYPTHFNKYPEKDLILDWNDKSKYTLNLTGNLEIDRLFIPSGLHEFTIQLNGEDRIIIVNELESMGSINVIGNGKLTIMVKSSMKFGSGTVNSAENVKNLDIFYAGTKEPDFGGNMKIYGNLYVKQSPITIAGSSGIQGNVLSGGEEITITGGSNNIVQLFFAPNAHVKFTGGGKLEGKVIAKDFTITGGGMIEYAQPDIEDDLFLPGFPDDSIGSGGGKLVETGASPSITTTQPMKEID